MILVTGGTGFVGRVLVRQLVEAGHEVRTLLRPSQKSPRLPKGVPVEVSVVSLNDLRGLRAALRGVDYVYHLAGGESEAQLFETDIQGTKTLVQAARRASIQQIVYLSHLGADKASAFPTLRAKGLAEEYVRKSEIPYTILRSSIIFGPEDNFTTQIARFIRMAPGIIFLPNKGETLLQPLWVEDLVTCLLWSLDNLEHENQTYKVGGGEYLTLKQIFQIITFLTRKKRIFLSAPTPLLRTLNLILEASLPSFPFNSFFLDYLATDRTCATDSLPRLFNLMPARFNYRLNYLETASWLERMRERVKLKR